MVTVGYARVSTREQSADSQADVLEAAGCARVFVDHASGTLARRPALTEALSYLRDGDTLVVTKLDRLGRSVKNLKEVADPDPPGAPGPNPSAGKPSHCP